MLMALAILRLCGTVKEAMVAPRAKGPPNEAACRTKDRCEAAVRKTTWMRHICRAGDAYPGEPQKSEGLLSRTWWLLGLKGPSTKTPAGYSQLHAHGAWHLSDWAVEKMIETDQ